MDIRKRCVIIGGNFGGLAAARMLARKMDVVVIDKSPFFEFLPNIHELISGVKKKGHLRINRKSICKGFGVRFVQKSVTTIDRQFKKVITRDNERFKYDYCIVAIGGVHTTYNIPGAAKYSHPFKSVAECDLIFKTLQRISYEKKRLRTVIVGGGLEGIEALGEILRKYGKLPGLTVTLIESQNQLLQSALPTVDRDIREMVAPYNVAILTGKTVISVDAQKIVLEDDRSIDYDIVIWTGGVVPSPLLYAAGLAERKNCWAPVSHYLNSIYDPSIFVVGDAAEFPEHLSKQAYNALDMGEAAASNILRMESLNVRKPFQPSGKPMLVSLGHLTTYMIFEDKILASPTLASLKEAVYHLVMSRFENIVAPSGFLKFGSRIFNTAVTRGLPLLFSPGKIVSYPKLRILT